VIFDVFHQMNKTVHIEWNKFITINFRASSYEESQEIIGVVRIFMTKILIGQQTNGYVKQDEMVVALLIKV
jgi:hypothetical protein